MRSPCAASASIPLLGPRGGESKPTFHEAFKRATLPRAHGSLPLGERSRQGLTHAMARGDHGPENDEHWDGVVFLSGCVRTLLASFRPASSGFVLQLPCNI
jgi:hypothetical protein